MNNHLLFQQVSVPPETLYYLERPRLNARLEEAVKKPLVTLVAGVGYGKTQLISSFLKRYPRRIIWSQISPLDNIVSHWWNHIVYCISLQNETLADRLRLLGFPGTLVSFENFLHIITDSLKPDRKYYLVFDDFHLISNSEILWFVHSLIQSQIANVTVIILSRKPPELELTSLLSRNTADMITEDDLRFTEEEIADYFKSLHINIAKKEISNIFSETGGWILAIYLVALSMRRGESQISPLRTLKPDIFKLMESQIFQPLPQALQQLLIKMSFIGSLPLELLQEIAHDQGESMKAILNISSFIRYDNFSGNCQIHYLFLEYLRQKQDQVPGHEVNRLYLKTADWFAKRGDYLDAIRYYMKINHYEEVIKIFFTCSFRVSVSMADFAINTLSTIAGDRSEPWPVINILKGRFLINNFRTEEAKTELNRAILHLENQPLTTESQALLGEAYFILALTHWIESSATRNYDHVQLFKKADNLLPKGSKIFDYKHLHLNGGSYANVVFFPDKKSQLDFEVAMSEMLPHLIHLTGGSGSGAKELIATEKAYFQKKFALVEEFAYDAMSKAKQAEQYDIENMAVFYLIRLYFAQGDYYKIKSLLRKLNAVTELHGVADAYRVCDIIEGWFFSMIHMPQKAAGWLHEEDERKNDSPITFGIDRLVRARCFFVDKRFAELEAQLNNQKNLSLNNFVIGACELKALQAVLSYQIGNKAKALQRLEDAYNLANSNEYLMPFIENGKDMRTLANYALSQKNHTISAAWLKNISMKSSTYAKKQSEVIKAYQLDQGLVGQDQNKLTNREMAVLADLCQGLSREEIASNCNLSRSTVRSILESVFNKLGAKNSIEAVRIATKLRLL